MNSVTSSYNPPQYFPFSQYQPSSPSQQQNSHPHKPIPLQYPIHPSALSSPPQSVQSIPSNFNSIQIFQHALYNYQQQQQKLFSYSHSSNSHRNTNRSTPSILPQYNKSQPNKLIQNYLLHNLTDHNTMTLKTGVLSIQYMTNSTYIGQVKQNINQINKNNIDKDNQIVNYKHGKGIYKYSNHDIYMGDWQNDNFNGIGMYVFANGDMYQGLFKDGNNLKGKFIYANGDVYEGQFKDGYRHGFGIMKYRGNKQLLRENNNTNKTKDDEYQYQYSGNWQKDKKHGKGTYKQKQLTITGLWEEDKINGQVIINGKNFEYAGIMANQQFIKGEIKIKYIDSMQYKYEGEVYRGQFQGNGKYQDNYLSYDGEFKQGRIQGKGTYKIIQNNNYNENCGIFYSGDLNQKGIPNGAGKMIYNNGDIYEGRWKQGMKEGVGTYRYKIGELYEGEFARDKFEGNGKYQWQNGQFYMGKFINGSLLNQNFNLNNNIRLISQSLIQNIFPVNHNQLIKNSPNFGKNVILATSNVANRRTVLSPQKNIQNIQQNVNSQIISANIKPSVRPLSNQVPNTNRFPRISRSPQLMNRQFLTLTSPPSKTVMVNR